MDPLAWLLGSSTRAGVVRALSSSDKPLTSYRVAKRFNLNVPKVYKELGRMAEVGLVKASMNRKAREYSLADDDLRRLALRMSPGFVTLEGWSSEEARKLRFRAGLGKKKRNSKGATPANVPVKPTRSPGELESLARLGRRAFDSRYREMGPRTLGAV
ncbi:MAG: winged helix-turn-helix transcriptional regulator [Nitrososphaerota archaeon]|nr:winged helix-turn-helix transcriptional regulator [Nitrososphaerota archaeon]